MTVTISRLYDNYADAQKAVQGLEAAGVPHSDISIVAGNPRSWPGGRSRLAYGNGGRRRGGCRDGWNRGCPDGGGRIQG